VLTNQLIHSGENIIVAKKKQQQKKKNLMVEQKIKGKKSWRVVKISEW
jgi:hypothetical protein